MTLLTTLVLVCGRVNSTNLSRYSHYSERTYRRQYEHSFNFLKLNQKTIEQAISPATNAIITVDASFIAKAGKCTYGLGKFYNGSHSRVEKGLEISGIRYQVSGIRYQVSGIRYQVSGIRYQVSGIRYQDSRVEKGLEISVVAVIDVESNQGYSLSVQQTPPSSEKESRVDDYLEQLKISHPYFPKQVRYVVADGFYSKKKWVKGVTELGMEAMGKLRSDADLKYIYEGKQQGRDRPRRYDEKVKKGDLSRLDVVAIEQEGKREEIKLYSKVVWSKNFECKIRLVYVSQGRGNGEESYAMLFSTDLELGAKEIYKYYKARFQIEFLFRDGKQFTGLGDCQARDMTKLDFHFNSSLSALNIAKLNGRQEQGVEKRVFSMASQKRLELNNYLLERFMTGLGLDQTLIKSHPNYRKLCYHGVITP